MPFVSDIGSLSILERHSSGASHWLSMSDLFRCLSDIPLVLVTGSRCRFTVVSWQALGAMQLVFDVGLLSFLSAISLVLVTSC